MDDQKFFVLVVVELQNFVDLDLHKVVALRDAHEVADQLSVQPSLVGLDLATKPQSSMFFVLRLVQFINRGIFLGRKVQRD